MTVYNDFPLSEILWYKIGGACKYLLEAETSNDIREAIEFINKNNIQKYLVIGIGANLLVSDSFYDGAVIKLYREKDTKHIHTENGVTNVFAGELLDDLIHYCFENNLLGFEWAGGLPSTVGGAIRGNVGAFGHEIEEYFHSARVFDLSTITERVMQRSELEFAYRTSIIKQQKHFIVLEASFRFRQGSPAEMDIARKMYHDNWEYRKVNHPLEYPSCGSTFKNIVEKEKVERVIQTFPDVREMVESKWHGKVSSGHLIEKLGFSGYQIGNAKASEKHPNFIVNLGGAKFDDVRTIIQHIQQKFTQTLGFSPEVEVEIVQ